MTNKARILVVDNEYGPRESIRLALDRDFEVTTAESGAAALKAVEDVRPDLVISDIKMPGMDGLEVLRRIKARDATIEVILITAYASVETAKSALTHGATEYLVKPFELRDLKAAVGRALLARREVSGPQAQVARLVREMRLLAAKTFELEEAARADSLMQSLRVAQLSVLQEISQGILAQLELPGLIPAITDAIRGGFGYDTVSILQGAERPDADQDPAYVGCPLRDGQTLLGYLVVDNRRSGRPVDRRERELLDMLAAYVVIAFRNSRLYDEAERRRRTAESLADVGRIVSQSLDPKEVGQRIADSVRSLLDARCSALYRLDAASAELTTLAVSGEAEAAGFEQEIGVIRLAVTSAQAVATPDLLLDASIPVRSTMREHLEQSASRAVLALPLVLKGAVVGVLSVRDHTGRAFDAEQVRLAQAFADHAVLAIKNVELFGAERTARAEAEEAARALRASEEKYRGLVEGSIQGMAIHRDSIIHFANPVLARMFGYDHPDELVGRDCQVLISAPERSRVTEFHQACLRGEGGPARYECAGVRKDGSVVWTEVFVSVVSRPDGPAVLETFADITDRKRAEAALRESEAQLRQAQKMEAIGRLAGGVAHDFNNLLTIISGRAGLVLTHRALDPALARNVDLIAQAAERAAALTQRLLAFSRKQVLQPKVADLNTIVSGMAVMLRRLIGEDIELVTVLDPALGHVKADRSQIEQVIMNLAVNSRDAMPEGGKLVITTANGAAGPAPTVTLAVSDTGIGMDTETRAHLFEPFFTTKELGKGTGLGLSTVYGIVQQHGGQITVETAPMAGSTFTIHLPPCNDALPGGEVDAATPQAARGSETVLLVEDEEGIRSLASEVLEGRGYTVLKANNGVEALEICERHPAVIHLLVTDVVMPKMGGWQLAQRVTAARPDVGVLYMSGYTAESVGQRGVLAADTVFLHKPFTPEALVRGVREVLDARARRRPDGVALATP
jgi:PAS domain S-box-containing protein